MCGSSWPSSASNKDLSEQDNDNASTDCRKVYKTILWLDSDKDRMRQHPHPILITLVEREVWLLHYMPEIPKQTAYPIRDTQCSVGPDVWPRNIRLGFVIKSWLEHYTWPSWLLHGLTRVIWPARSHDEAEHIMDLKGIVHWT